MGTCNHCSLKRIRQTAKQNGMKVTVLSDAKWGMGGQNIYVHPRSINISKLPGDEDGERAQYRQAWMMEIPNHCCC